MNRTLICCAALLLSLVSVKAVAQEGLTLQEKAAKMLIVGFKGTNMQNSPILKKNVVERGVSGIIFFECNITPVSEGKDSKAIVTNFAKEIQALTPRHLFIAIDQEGGRVNRLKTKYGFEEMVSHQTLGDADDLAYTQSVAATIASEVSGAGFNLNFAPSVDVNVNPSCPVIGAIGRSFSADENKVIDHSIVYIQEHHKKGVLTSLKHFPGHGSSQVDSHLGFTDVTDTWQEREMTPFVELMDKGLCDMVMVSHVFNSRFDSQHPASLSKSTIDSLLRKELGWNGVVISDDMQMKAITNKYGFEESIQRGVEAGLDMFIVATFDQTPETDMTQRAIDAIVDGVKSGRFSEERIDESLERIERLRLQLD
ncbi:MAG: glycoside hydrolase family 3 N-terminal domain-containing protein [Rikenellaceae bacterium]